MKKLFLAMMAIVALFATSCQKETSVSVGEEATVSFNISTPEIATRVYSDGKTATNLQYAVYDAAGNELTNLTVTDGTINITATVNLQLTTGNTYSVIFWAAAPDAPYTVDFAGKKMTVDYNSAVSNDEGRDAFYAYHTFEVKGTQTETIKLYRPFAQLNIGTADYATSEKAGYNPTQSAVTVPVYKTLNFTDGTVADEETVTFAAADIKKDEKFPVDGYQYLAMNYLLVANEKATVDVEFSYADGTNVKTRTVGSVPVQRNYRTNIYGSLLTSEVDINVIIEPTYNEPANAVEVWDGVSITEPAVNPDNANEYVIDQASDLAWFAAAVNGTLDQTRAAAATDFSDKTFVLTCDIDLNNENWTPIGYWEKFSGVFDGGNHTISNLKHHGTKEDCYVGLFGYTENATIKNLTINNVDITLKANADWAGGHIGALVGNIEGNTTIENINITGDIKINGDLTQAGAGRIGGVVGGNSAVATFRNVHVNAKEGSFVKGNSSVGGIVGQLQGETTFENCSANINVSAQQFYAGGIIGLAATKTSFSNCSASGEIRVLAGREGNDNDLFRVGAIAGGWGDNGANVLTLTDCSYTATLFGASADGRTTEAFDCDGFVGRGYAAKVGVKVSVNGQVYEYQGNGIYTRNGILVVSTGDALVAALGQNEDVVFGGDIKINPANMSNAYGKTGILVYNGQTIDGAGHKLDVKGAGGTWDSGICTSGGLIKNLWVTGSFRGIFVKGADHIEKVVLENVRIEGTTYTISIDQASKQGLEATNSIFRGWTSYAATIGNVKFTGCTFGAGAGYNFSRPYAPTEYVNCTFEEGHEIDPRAAVTFENCTFNGEALTADNLATLVISNIANASVK